MKREEKKLLPKINFPTWKTILVKLLEEEIIKNPSTTIPIAQYLNQFAEKMDLIQNDIMNKSASISLQMMIRSMANYCPDKTLPELSEIQKKFSGTKNEFHTIFNIEKNNFEWVSENITNVLGIKPEDFSLNQLIGSENNQPLIHSEDISHFMRWAGISYLLFSIPGFTFESNTDYQIVKFRISTEKSQIATIKNLKYVLITKKSSLHISEETVNSFGIPKYHFDTWSISEPSYFDIVKPMFVTSFDQSQFMNNLAFVINAMLIDIPVKYLMIINQRGNHDRNKSVAHHINQNIRLYANVNFEFDENKIGDYLNKSIKPKITSIAKIWCPELKSAITGDLEIVNYTKKLGLYNMPNQIERLIYQNIDFE